MLRENGKTRFADKSIEVRAAHILMETASQANEILQEINDGKISFEDAAKKSSKCPSGTKGGDLGYFGHGAMVKEFEDSAFSTAIGEHSSDSTSCGISLADYDLAIFSHFSYRKVTAFFSSSLKEFLEKFTVIQSPN